MLEIQKRMREIKYSIKDLENFSEIKAHTIRIWEQRYNLLEPKRTKTNIRYYSENDLKKILNIKLLNSFGIKISKIAVLSEKEILDQSKELILSNLSENHSEIDKLTLFILDFNGSEIKAFLNKELEKRSMEDLYEFTILPLLEKIGMLWQVNSIEIIHEHYFSTIYREFLISTINNVALTSGGQKSAILFLHDNEEHEFTILLYQYLLKKAGYACHYFGQKAPMDELILAFERINPDFLISTFTSKINEKIFNKIQAILEEFSSQTNVLVSGSQLNNFDVSKKIKKIDNIDELISLIN